MGTDMFKLSMFQSISSQGSASRSHIFVSAALQRCQPHMHRSLTAIDGTPKDTGLATKDPCEKCFLGTI